MYLNHIWTLYHHQLSGREEGWGKEREEGKEKREEGREGKGKDCFSRDGIVRGGMNHK